MPHPPRNNPPGQAGPAAPIEGTRLESAEEIRKAVLAHKQAAAKPSAPKAGVPPADVPLFRPVRRPPMALLCILDDGRDDGEWLRLRGDRVVIGRSEGDVVIPHDNMMSSRHAELSRHVIDGGHRWVITDLQSTNGTFVRVGNSLVKPSQELLVGGRRYRFQIGPSVAETVDEQPRGTLGWQAVSPTDLHAALVELTNSGEGMRYPLTKAENWVGSDPSMCSVVLAGDTLVSPRHLRVYKDKKGRWHVENAHSVNGVWLRVLQMPVEGSCHFQLGEQRFVVGVL